MAHDLKNAHTPKAAVTVNLQLVPHTVASSVVVGMLVHRCFQWQFQACTPVAMLCRSLCIHGVKVILGKKISLSHIHLAKLLYNMLFFFFFFLKMSDAKCRNSFCVF